MPTVFVVSDATGGTAERVVQSALVQFSDADVRLLSTLANSMSVALENARLFDETNKLLARADQQATELATVNRISRALVSQLELDALIRLVGNQIQQTFQADIAYLALLDDEGKMTRCGCEELTDQFGNRRFDGADAAGITFPSYTNADVEANLLTRPINTWTEGTHDTSWFWNQCYDAIP